MTGIVAAKFHVSVEDVEQLNNKLSQIKKLSRCERGRMLFMQLCQMTKTQHTLERKKLEQRCKTMSNKSQTMRRCESKG